MKKPYNQFPLITIKRVLHMFIIIAGFAIVIWVIPWSKITPEYTSEQITALKITATSVAALAVILWSLIYSLPYALWIRKTGLALPNSTLYKTHIAHPYGKEVEQYNVTVTAVKNKFIGISFLLILAWLVVFIISMMILVAFMSSSLLAT